MAARCAGTTGATAVAAVLAVLAVLGTAGCGTHAGPVAGPRPVGGQVGATTASASPGAVHPCAGAVALLPADLPVEVPLPALTLTSCRTGPTTAGTTWALAFALGRETPARLFTDQSSVMRHTGFAVASETTSGARGGRGSYTRGRLVVDIGIDRRAVRLTVVRRP